MNALERQNRKRHAAEGFRQVYPHLGLSVETLEKGPFKVTTEWKRGLGISSRMLEYYLAGTNLPTGRRLETIERFVVEARKKLRRAGVVLEDPAS